MAIGSLLDRGESDAGATLGHLKGSGSHRLLQGCGCYERRGCSSFLSTSRKGALRPAKTPPRSDPRKQHVRKHNRNRRVILRPAVSGRFSRAGVLPSKRLVRMSLSKVSTWMRNRTPGRKGDNVCLCSKARHLPWPLRSRPSVQSTRSLGVVQCVTCTAHGQVIWGRCAGLGWQILRSRHGEENECVNPHDGV